MARTMGAGAALAAVLMAGPPAAAQTAGDINRLNAAMQICNSPAGATVAECAKLRGGLGSGAPSFGGGGAAAGLMGALGAAMSARQAAAPSPVPAGPAADTQAIAACVRAAGADTTAIQACLASASAPRLAAPSMAPSVPRLGQPIMPAARNPDTATAIHQAGQSYQACAAANPTNWQSCLPLLNGGAPR